jgi:hypothetical protein
MSQCISSATIYDNLKKKRKDTIYNFTLAYLNPHITTLVPWGHCEVK